jgi:hypothetical protein
VVFGAFPICSVLFCALSKNINNTHHHHTNGRRSLRTCAPEACHSVRVNHRSYPPHTYKEHE